MYICTCRVKVKNMKVVCRLFDKVDQLQKQKQKQGGSCIHRVFNTCAHVSEMFLLELLFQNTLNASMPSHVFPVMLLLSVHLHLHLHAYTYMYSIVHVRLFIYMYMYMYCELNSVYVR